MATFHAQPEYQIHPQGDPPPGYPAEPVPDEFRAFSLPLSSRQRRDEYFAHVLKNPAPLNTKPVWYELVRMAAGGQAYEGVIFSALDFINARKDCADFVLHGILRLLYQFDPGRGNSLAAKYPPSGQLLERARQTTLGFKYFPDEPGIDSMCTWTENHYILFTSAAYLSGQLYPDQVFTNSGETGREKMARNKPRILRWLEMRFRSGFNEWLSHVYYDEDLVALLSLLDFAEDQEIRARAEIMIDLVLLDMALNSFQGVFGSTHGRAYENTKKWASNEGTTDTMRLLFGVGVYSAFDNMSAPAFSLSRYRLPPALAEISADRENSFTNRQRMGFLVEEADRWGLEYDDLESGMLFYTSEAYLHPLTANLTIRMFDAFNWWENDFFQPFKPYRNLLRLMKTLGLTPALARFLKRDVSRNMREEPNVYTRRTPDYMLSTAQDHRAGYGGDQHHIWQATLGPDAVCFTTHPAKIEGPSPNYWAGSGLLPRAAQYRNLTIAVYKIERIPALYVPIKHFYTHAWLPQDKFDKVVERDSWVFARKGSGYLALRSMQPAFWNSEDAHSNQIEFRREPEDFNRELIAPGAQNIWLCQLGREADDGSFDDFITAITAARLSFSGLQVDFDSPGNGLVQFGWQGALVVNGKEIDLHGYPRYDNPYVQAEYDPRKISINTDNHSLHLDWTTSQRTLS